MRIIKDQSGSVYAPLMLIMAVIILILGMQMSIIGVELRVSNLHSRYSGLFNLAVSVCESREAEHNKLLTLNEAQIIQAFMGRPDWHNFITYSDGVFLLDTAEFTDFYREHSNISPDSRVMDIKHSAGLKTQIMVTETVSANKTIKIDVLAINLTEAPMVKNIQGKVKLIANFAWNTDYHVVLKPKFEVTGELSELLKNKSFSDFEIQPSKGQPLLLTGLLRV
jgi:hypothetical protein